MFQRVQAKLLNSKALAYGVTVNVASFGLFGYDKYCAQQKQWRVPEATLCLSAGIINVSLTLAMGGWIGGLIAMQKFRHKTKKQSFQQQYFMAVAGNVGLVLYLLA
jgi:uncharacterized membrane protein YsdA (DUF1294 family)